MDIPITDDNGLAKSRHTPSYMSVNRRLSGLVDSPILLIVLVLATVAVGAKWYTLQASLRAPNIPGWSWTRHPNSLLIYYPNSDCGCGPGLEAVLKQAQAHHLAVIVLTDAKGEKLNTVSKAVSDLGGSLLVQKQLSGTQGWEQTGSTVVVRIHEQRIVDHANGTNLPRSFYS